MKIYDITLPLRESLASWPGDVPYRFERVCTIGNGTAVNLGAVTMSAHAGTHTDAPYHFQNNGATMETLSLAPYLGPALVLDVSGKPLIQTEDFAACDFAGTPRLLLKTNAWTDHTRFPDSIPILNADVPAYLRARGVILVGLDVPSVDQLDSKDLPIHHALAACGISILENLDMARVPEGRYELLALPLKLVGADGAPVRAVLREMNGSAPAVCPS